MIAVVIQHAYFAQTALEGASIESTVIKYVKTLNYYLVNIYYICEFIPSKMMTSGGGGYCDCGDPEAWKQYPCCELHTPTTRAPTDPDSPESYQVFIDKLPKDLIQRATELFQILIEYVFEILGAASSEELPPHLKPE